MNTFPDEAQFAVHGYRHGSMILKLTAPFRYHSKRVHETITVPKGFLTDGASVPRIFWSFFSPFGEYFKAALIHDFLYTKENKSFNRIESDKIFLEAMIEVGVPYIRRSLIYRAVRLGGWRFFAGSKS
jgi:hypothetical protein